MELAKMFVLAAFFIIQVHANIQVLVTIRGHHKTTADEDIITVQGTKETSDADIVTVAIADMQSHKGLLIEKDGKGLKAWAELHPTYHLLVEDVEKTKDSLVSTLGLDIPELADDASVLNLSKTTGYLQFRR